MKEGYRWLSLMLSEILGTFVLAHFFALAAFYNRGIQTIFVDGSGDDDDDGTGYYSTLESGVLPPWAQAFIIAGAMFFLYLLGSRFAQRHLHLNPLISTCVVISDVYRGFYAGTSAPGFVAAGNLVVLWISQAIGNFAGAAVVWAFTKERLSDASIYLGGAETEGGVVTRAWVSELLFGTLLLILLAFWLRPIAYKEENVKGVKKAMCDYGIWAAGFASFYFFYLTLFWVYSKASIDFIREGAYCAFTQIDVSGDNNPCSPGVYNTTAGLYLFFLTIQGILVLIGLIAAVIMGYSYYDGKGSYTKLSSRMKMR